MVSIVESKYVSHSVAVQTEIKASNKNEHP